MRKEKIKQKFSVAEVITKRFIDALEQDIVPWRKTWKATQQCNYVSLRPYHGINKLLLSEFPEQFFITYNQCAKLGGKVLPKSKGIPIVFYKMIAKKDKAGNEVEGEFFPLLRYSNVFKLSDTNLSPKQIEVAKEDKPVDIVKKIIQKHNIIIKYGNPAYSPSKDIIYMPPSNSFKNSEFYLKAFLHEALHFSGASKRMNRDLSALFGTHDYSYEEIIAEIGASLCAAYLNCELPETASSSKAYVQNWIKVLKNDKTYIIRACAQAEKAARFLLEGIVDFKENDLVENE